MAVLKNLFPTHTRILTVEEGAVVNGFGAFLARELTEMPEAKGVQVKILGIPDEFVAHGGRAELLREIDLDAQGIEEWARAMVGEGEKADIPKLETA